MADVTGGTPPTGSSEFDVPGDLADVYDHFGDTSKFAVADAASLPASGNWPGRMLMTSDTGFVYRWLGSAWKMVAGDTGDVDVTYSTGWSTDSVQGTYRVLNGMLSLNGRIKATVSVGSAVMFVLPVGARPTAQRVTFGQGNGGDQTIIFDTNGNVSMSGRGTIAVTDMRLATIPPQPVT